ncbi:hypothetical protein B0I37DRAFT_432324 [Chaetomium sp. MPI-CAGE-AT-0009]|nr:hypothetical protein B0I37DRAFT_432324 [Chaetomium sp. MPI-CAGE-AT-0009]
MPINPLLPDEEIVESFTEEERKFYDWYNEASDTIWSTDGRRKGGVFELSDRIMASWPDPEVRARYCQWQNAWSGRAFDRLRRVVPQSEFLDTISATNFGSVSSRARHLWMMEMQNTPFCLLGESDFGGVLTGYAMDPGPAYLWPNFEYENDADLVHRNILAINTNVRVEGEFIERQDSAQTSPRRRRGEAESSGGDTIRSADSGDADCAGGGTKPWTELRISQRKAIVRGPWAATGFGVILEIDSRGRPGPVWVIYSFHTIDDDDTSGEQRHHHIRIMAEGSSTPFSYIGRLTPACDRTFTVAKIAKNLAELKDGSAKIDFQVEAVVEFLIVRVKACLSSPGMPLVRQFVKAD